LHNVLAVCTLRAPLSYPCRTSHPSLGPVRPKPLRWQKPRSKQKSRSQAPAGSPGTPTPAPTTTPASTTPASTTLTVRPCALFQNTSCKRLQHFHVVQPPPSSSCARGLCMSRVGFVQFGSFFCVADASDKGSPRHGQCLLTCCWLSLLFAAAGSLRASMLCLLLCMLHLLCLLRWLIFALSPNSFSRSLSLLSCLARSQRRGHLQCAT
jgi:hypothetical protein